MSLTVSCILLRLKYKIHPLCFTKINFKPITFKFIQLRLFHQLLLYVVINFPIFQNFLLIFFKLRKNSTND